MHIKQNLNLFRVACEFQDFNFQPRKRTPFFCFVFLFVPPALRCLLQNIDSQPPVSSTMPFAVSFVLASRILLLTCIHDSPCFFLNKRKTTFKSYRIKQFTAFKKQAFKHVHSSPPSLCDASPGFHRVSSLGRVIKVRLS